jgi:hypothetical protein
LARESTEDGNGGRVPASGGGIVNPSLDLDEADLERIAARLTAAGVRPTSRALFKHVVRARLPGVVSGLRRLGFRGARGGRRRRPRRMDVATWDAVRLAAEQTGLSAAEILYACCVLAAESSPGEPDQASGDRPASRTQSQISINDEQ